MYLNVIFINQAVESILFIALVVYLFYIYVYINNAFGKVVLALLCYFYVFNYIVIVIIICETVTQNDNRVIIMMSEPKSVFIFPYMAQGRSIVFINLFYFLLLHHLLK